jgi:hypothetical protein
MLQSFPVFKKNGAHLVEKNDVWKKTRIVHSRSLSVLNMKNHFLFVSSFEHVNFEIDEKYSKNIYDNLNYYASLVTFQT